MDVPNRAISQDIKVVFRNKARSEGSIAEAYIADEYLTFCSKYLDDIETKFNHHSWYGDVRAGQVPNDMSEIFSIMGNPFGAFTNGSLTHE